MQSKDFGLRNLSNKTLCNIISHLFSNNNTTVVTAIIFPAVIKGFYQHNKDVRKEYVKLFIIVVGYFKYLVFFHYFLHRADYCNFQSLITEQDEMESVMENLIHIQARQRQKGFSQISKLAIGCPNFTILLPFCMHAFFEESDSNLIDEAINALASICSTLSWEQYYKQLINVTKIMSTHRDKEKVLIKAFCKILDFFTFSDSSLFSITRTFSKKLIPKLHSFLVEKKTRNESVYEIVRVPVALALVKVLMKLPTLFNIEFPRVITILSNQCASRTHSVFTTARNTLVEIAVLVGPSFFSFMLAELTRALARGFQRHYLGLVVHLILEEVVSHWQIGQIDPCIEDLLKV